MGTALLLFGTVYAALAVWLVVRISNLGRRRDKWALATLVAAPVLYLLSFGLACRLAASESTVVPFAKIRWFCRPVMFVAESGPAPLHHAIEGLAGLCGGRTGFSWMAAHDDLDKMNAEIDAFLQKRIAEKNAKQRQPNTE